MKEDTTFSFPDGSVSFEANQAAGNMVHISESSLSESSSSSI